jgi:hypothetical protein
MTDKEQKDYQQKMKWLPSEHAEQWTEPVREAWLRMRKAYGAFELTGTAPTETAGSIKENGRLTPLWIPNDEYIRYQETARAWRGIEPKYINENRARLSLGDFEEEDA